ncbi:hypothetical protein GCM10010218_34970 [Streptomyces mashuensis]|uniref:Histidine kinase/HSP90-like ATPase domain-containing protein n=1 Tax=Streptomyces mashuensis TaxID=33904 RepID=A0A919B5Q1_9ACTN|nr:ATP-binding protein [Streptomyces mashuensis]GHF50435.1 hypothetical protein GCM10010218_34970 [Streptomyces mashuensis]
MSTTTPATYFLAAPASAATARIAREFVTAILVAAGREALIDDARVCVSDAVTNVVQHARVDALTIEVGVHAHRVVFAVRDDDPGRRPYRRAARSDDERGRGLALVRGLACDSGVALVWEGLDVVGKRVWFSLSA